MAMYGDRAGNISFYIGGQLAAQAQTVSVYQPAVMLLGSESASIGPGFCYDDINCGSGTAPVPEPSGLMVLAPGLLGFFGLRRRLAR